MYINDIIVTQNALRHPEQVDQMIDLVKQGDHFSVGKLAEYDPKSTRLIELYELDDGIIYIHNGHHRLWSIYKAGRTFLYKDEFTLKPATYEWFAELNPEAGWYTPYDLRTEIRLANLQFWKSKAAYHYNEIVNPKDFDQWVRDHDYLYLEDREIEKIWELGTNSKPTKVI